MRTMKYLTVEELERLFDAPHQAMLNSYERVDIIARDTAILRVAYHRGLRASEIGILRFEDYRPPANSDAPGRLYVRRLKGSRSGEYLLTIKETQALESWIRYRGSKTSADYPCTKTREEATEDVKESIEWARGKGKDDSVEMFQSDIGDDGQITDYAFAFYKGLHEKEHAWHDLLFTTRQHTALSRNRFLAMLKYYGAIAGLPADKCHPHVLKHSCAVHLLNEKKLSIIELQDHLGHANINSTMVYAKFTRREEIGQSLQNWS